MFKLPQKRILISLLIPLVVLGLSLNIINSKYKFFTFADLNGVTYKDTGMMVWISESEYLPNQNKLRFLFKLNSLESEIDDVTIKMILPDASIKVSKLEVGVFGSQPELLQDNDVVYVYVKNIPYQGVGDLFTIELEGFNENVSKLIKFDKDESFVRGGGSKILLDLGNLMF